MKKQVTIILTLIFLITTCIFPLETFAKPSLIGIFYRGHVEEIGWQDFARNGTTAGTIEQSLRMEAISMNLENEVPGMGIIYQTHVQDIGWQDWVSGGQISGTTGQNLRMEAIKIQLVNTPAGYHVIYRTYLENFGWQDWVRDGEVAGTTGQSLRIEAIQIYVRCDGLGFSAGISEFTYTNNLTSIANNSFDSHGYSSTRNISPRREDILNGVVGAACVYINCHGGTTSTGSFSKLVSTSKSTYNWEIYPYQLNQYTRGFYKFVFIDACHSACDSSLAATFNIYNNDGFNHAFLGWSSQSFDSLRYRWFNEELFSNLKWGENLTSAIYWATYETNISNYQVYGDLNMTY